MHARWKMIYLARRNPALRPEQFAQAWREHSALGAGCSNVRDKVLSVMQCARVLGGASLPDSSTDYDGVNLLHIRDRGVADDLWAAPQTQAIMRPDEARVCSTYVRSFTLVCEESLLRDLPRGNCVVVAFLRRGCHAGDAQWQAGRDGAAALIGAGRCVWNRVDAEPPPGYRYDAIAEWWYESADAARLALAAGGLAQQLPDALAQAIDPTASVFMFTQVTHHRP